MKPENELPLAAEIRRDIESRVDALRPLLDEIARLNAELAAERQLRYEIAEDLREISEMFPKLSERSETYLRKNESPAVRS